MRMKLATISERLNPMPIPNIKESRDDVILLDSICSVRMLRAWRGYRSFFDSIRLSM